MANKKSAVANIIINSILIVVLIAILVAFIDDFPVLSIKAGSFNKNDYTRGGGETGSISELEIDWDNGNVTVETYDGDSVVYYEEGVTDSKKEMYCAERDGKLSILSGSPKRVQLINIKPSSKSLTVKIPANMEQLKNIDIDCVSADVNISGINAEELSIDNASGNIKLTDTNVFSLDADGASGNISSENLTVTGHSSFDTASGAVSLCGSIASADFDTASGDVKLISDVCPSEIDADTASGDIEIYIPSDSGFICDYESVSGRFKTDFDVSADGRCGNGNSDFSFDTVSGSISIYKL